MTLGAADTEFDQLVVEGSPVVVRAVVEAKRNPNDLAHGFRRRQQNLAWLSGDRQRYDPERYRNRQYPTGLFDREFVHKQYGQSFVFDPDSFQQFQPDESGWVWHGLYMVTRAGTLWGVHRKALARIAFRAAVDPRFDLDNLADFQVWCESLDSELETPDLLQLYAQS